jgi:hypothetical protein
MYFHLVSPISTMLVMLHLCLIMHVLYCARLAVMKWPQEGRSLKI